MRVSVCMSICMFIKEFMHVCVKLYIDAMQQGKQ